ncbi:hypothetical protein HPB50_024812 [Hyalomma asiaticum]|uniref:Uncharacterized protein n=1 Tax=Hyalomma asiaticum TaxID=266040 RepID=A0ACB7T970_HYAAI|nr:hypothetical protein HPB50_024812 [Hyalomma asiaticum]
MTAEGASNESAKRYRTEINYFSKEARTEMTSLEGCMDTEGLALSIFTGPPDHGVAQQGVEDDEGSSASEVTAVATELPGGLGRRIQRRVREVEDELSRFLSDSSNKEPVSARNFVMSRVCERVGFTAEIGNTDTTHSDYDVTNQKCKNSRLVV